LSAGGGPAEGVAAGPLLATVKDPLRALDTGSLIPHNEQAT